ncbi:MAG: hypothetical protein JJE55_15425 [Flavobacteriaceae bacterium]|nr:hypothetical protein [Flavobacteriaceae bacterium]
MDTTLLKRIALISLFGSMVLLSGKAIAQVGVNKSTPSAGALLEVESTDKGFLMTRVALTGTDDVSTITPAPVATGVMVYNTATAGLESARVTPGFYYWNGSNWRRFYNQGYALIFNQTGSVTAPIYNKGVSNLVYKTLPGLDTGNITVPFSGTYQIRVEGYYAAGNFLGSRTNGDGASQGSISLAWSISGSATINTLKETYLTTSSKRIKPGDPAAILLEGLAQSATIIYNIDLSAGTTYRFMVRGREWLPNDVQAGIFGKTTDNISYPGANGVSDAQRGTMTISLIKQF